MCVEQWLPVEYFDMITIASTNKSRIFVEFETDMLETLISILVFMLSWLRLLSI